MAEERHARALKIITDWRSREFKNKGQKDASLQILIIQALDEQDYITRVACAESVLKPHGADAANLCINTKAI